jgi:hypothetical protein
MHYKGKLKLKSHNTSYCLIEAATRAGLTVSGFFYILVHVFCIVKYLTKQKFSFFVDFKPYPFQKKKPRSGQEIVIT